MKNLDNAVRERVKPRDVIFLVAVAVLLGLGFALAAPAAGAELGQSSEGSITGAVTIKGQGAAGIAVELRQRTNAGVDGSVASSSTDAAGNYSFPNQPSAPNDAFYYIRFSGREGTMSAWYTFPIIYVHGSDFTVPGVEMGDVELAQPKDGVLSLPGSLQWRARRSGETYRLFIYAEGKLDKAALDSGSLGANTKYDIPEGGLPEGRYEAAVQVRDAVVGYGQSQARFSFTVGKSASPPAEAAPPTPQPQPQATPQPTQAPAPDGDGEAAPGQPVAQPDQPAPSQGAGNEPNLQLSLSGDKKSVAEGGKIIYKLEVTNNSDAPLQGVVITDQLPAGVTVDNAGTTSTIGSVSVEGNTVKAEVGSLAPNEKVVVEIPASVGSEAGDNISNQASAHYTGASDPVQSNAYIAQVESQPAAPSVPSVPQAPQPQPQAPAIIQPEAPAAPSAPSSPPADQGAAPAGNPAGKEPAAPAANPPAKPNDAPVAQKPAAPQPNQQPAIVAQPPKAKEQQAAPPVGQPAKQPAASAQKPPTAPMPQTGGAFPIVFALLLLSLILLARYLRVHNHRRA